MHVIRARNVNDALVSGIILLDKEGTKRGSRNSEVIKLEVPVTTCYHKPLERCLLWPERKWPAPFMLMESLWMLAGRNDVAWIARYLPSFKDFSDNGETFHGAYGYRWRHHFGKNQLSEIITLLSSNPNSRRAVLQMYDAQVDLSSYEKGKDIPCNLAVVFSLRRPFLDSNILNLDIHVTCRSNDIIWGAYGANAVHFGFLLEYMTSMIHSKMVSNHIVIPGTYYQTSIDYHAYSNIFYQNKVLTTRVMHENPYESGLIVQSLISNPSTFDDELKDFIQRTKKDVLLPRYENTFFNDVASPVHEAYIYTKDSRFEQARHSARRISATDWNMAMSNWIAWQEKINAVSKKSD